jgi:cytochrome P450 family 110
MTLPPTINSPKVLQLWKWIVEPLDYLHKFDRECGDIFTVNMSSIFSGAVFVSHPQAIQQVLTNDTKQLSAPGSINQILKPFLGDRGVILLDGREHRQRRQLLMPQFHGDKVRNYTNAIQEITRNLIAGWQVGEKLNVRKEMEKITLSVILQTVFGLDRGKRYEQIREKLSKMLSLIESAKRFRCLESLGAFRPRSRRARSANL